MGSLSADHDVRVGMSYWIGNAIALVTGIMLSEVSPDVDLIVFTTNEVMDSGRVVSRQRCRRHEFMRMASTSPPPTLHPSPLRVEEVVGLSPEWEATDPEES